MKLDYHVKLKDYINFRIIYAHKLDINDIMWLFTH